MSGPALSHDDIFAKAKELRAAGVPLGEIDAYLTQKLAGNVSPSDAPPAAPHSKFSSAQLVGRANRSVANAQDEQDAIEPTYAQKALGGVASLARDIPGAEVAQAGVRAGLRGQSYPEALGDIRSAEDAAPSIVRNLNRGIGGSLAAAGIPGSAPLQGARYGIMRALTQANPDADVKERLHDAATEGTIGAGTGYLGSKLAAAIRAAKSPTRDAVAEAITQERASPAPTPPPVAVPEPLTREQAKTKLAELLQKNLDEGIAARDAVPPTKWPLMDRMERGLVGPSGRRAVPAMRTTRGDLAALRAAGISAGTPSP